MVILIFIFLTPKSWFSSGERALGTLHQSPVVKTLVIDAELIGNEEDRSKIEQRVKAMTGRTNFEVLEVRRIADAGGRTRSFEVDIR